MAPSTAWAIRVSCRWIQMRPPSLIRASANPYPGAAVDIWAVDETHVESRCSFECLVRPIA